MGDGEKEDVFLEILMMCRFMVGITLATSLVVPSQARPVSSMAESARPPWSSAAHLHRLPKAIHGTFTISSGGVEFRAEKEPLRHWSFEEIRTVALTNPRRLSLVTYQNGRWHGPGDRPFTFTLETPLPSEVAAELVREVGKPAINGDPRPEGEGLATLAARHKTSTGGSNGMLRFTDAGIDYLSKAGDARSWRWVDIETLANPEPYRFRVGGYLETFDFELKQPLARDLFDRLWDHVYAAGLNLNSQPGEINE